MKRLSELCDYQFEVIEGYVKDLACLEQKFLDGHYDVYNDLMTARVSVALILLHYLDCKPVHSSSDLSLSFKEMGID